MNLFSVPLPSTLYAALFPLPPFALALLETLVRIRKVEHGSQRAISCTSCIWPVKNHVLHTSWLLMDLANQEEPSRVGCLGVWWGLGVSSHQGIKDDIHALHSIWTRSRRLVELVI